MSRAWPLRLSIVLASALLAASCLEERYIGVYGLRCTSDRQCGAGAACLDGICAPADADAGDADAEADGAAIEVPRDAGGDVALPRFDAGL